MWYLAVIITVIYSAYSQQNNLLQECAKYYRPKNYLELLPNINMPYVDQLPVPNNVPNLRNKEYLNKIQNIVPSPAMTTKVLTVKTKYIYKNPVCVKYSKKQKLCKPEDGQIREHVDKLITKNYFVQNNIEERVDGVVDVISDENYVDEDRFSLKVSFDRLEPSEPDGPEEPRALASPSKRRTPSMNSHKLNELLIEDRLDQLETILPGYRRRRTYETSTIYVTKTMSNKRNMATLMVKNCVPIGYDVCPKKRKVRRSSKVTKRTYDSEENQFFFG